MNRSMRAAVARSWARIPAKCAVASGGAGASPPFRWASAASMAFMSAKLAQSGLKPGARHVR